MLTSDVVRNEKFLSEFVWIVTWINYLRDSLLRTNSGYIPNNTHLSFLTRAIFGKSPNDIPFVLKRKFTLLTRRSSLSVFAPKKHETDSPNTYRSHPCYSGWDTKRRNTRISNCLELLLVLFVVVLVLQKKNKQRHEMTPTYIRQMSSSECCRHLRAKIFKVNPDKHPYSVPIIILVICRFKFRTI